VSLPSKEVVDLLAFWASVATLVGLPIALAALLYAIIQFSLARRAGSAATVIPLFDGFRDCWVAYRGSKTESDRNFYFAELVNTLEVACAISRDRVLAGATQYVLEQYIVSVFQLIEGSPDALKSLTGLSQTSETFENIFWFIKLHRNRLKTASAAVATT
jgi:hypothetical protein